MKNNRKQRKKDKLRIKGYYISGRWNIRVVHYDRYPKGSIFSRTEEESNKILDELFQSFLIRNKLKKYENLFKIIDKEEVYKRPKRNYDATFELVKISRTYRSIKKQ